MINDQAKNIVVICGPTASGKTRLGVEIARYLGGEIISGDSRQVYRGMDIGTGKDLAEYTIEGRTIPCHLIDIADPAQIYTVYNYRMDFYTVFSEILGRKKLPVLVGGTGLYIEAVLRNYEIPEVPEDQNLREELMARDKQFLENELAKLAPDLYQSTDKKSKKRIVRSIEIAKYRKLNIRQKPESSHPPLRPVVLGIMVKRAQLKERIKNRLLMRFEQGMVDEVSRLLQAGVPHERLLMLGMEYKHIAGFLAGKTDFSAMSAALQHDIEQLSKRQATYFRGMERRGVAMHWINEANPEMALSVLRGYSFDLSC